MLILNIKGDTFVYNSAYIILYINKTKEIQLPVIFTDYTSMYIGNAMYISSKQLCMIDSIILDQYPGCMLLSMLLAFR